MFIREVTKSNKGYEKTYTYHYLVESVRTEDGPRQKLIYNLGTLDLPKEEWPLLANRIEDIITGQNNLYPASPEIEQLAQFYARKIIRKESGPIKEESDYRVVDVNNTEVKDCRSLGGEYICYSFLKRLKLDEYLEKIHFSKRQIEVAFLLIIGRLVKPISEFGTFKWGKNKSAIDELMDTDFTHLSKNTLYKVADKLYENKEKIEKYLAEQERNLFNLGETIILYDLTNSYFEGRAEGIAKAAYGNSKEKRYDCKLLTLGLVIDKEGFPKASKILPGNQDDPGSLRKMIDELRELASKKENIPSPEEEVTVVIDAGIATEDNLKKLRAEEKEDDERIHYIAVSRRKIDEYFNEGGELVTVREEEDKKVKVKLIEPEDEKDIFLYCHSEPKEKKEEAMRNKFETLFEQKLEDIETALHKKYSTKKYDKVCERIGRLREKYPIVSTFYNIDVIRGDKNKRDYAVKINWEYVKKEKADNKFSGRYYLRTDRKDLEEEEIFDIYTMLTRLEAAFRYLKTDLGLRPNYHQKGFRAEGHMFISVLAYHVLNSIQNRLHLFGYHSSWQTIMDTLSTHVRVTEKLPLKGEGVIYNRKCSKPEYEHKRIYELLQLKQIPLKTKKVEK